MAGLPGSRASVWVGPPLFCRGPSSGMMGLPAEPAWLPWAATLLMRAMPVAELVRLVLDVAIMAPTVRLGALELLVVVAKVLVIFSAVLPVVMLPPPKMAELPDRVLFCTVSVPNLL